MHWKQVWQKNLLYFIKIINLTKLFHIKSKKLLFINISLFHNIFLLSFILYKLNFIFRLESAAAVGPVDYCNEVVEGTLSVPNDHTYSANATPTTLVSTPLPHISFDVQAPIDIPEPAQIAE